MANLSIFEKKWLDLVFEGKNQEYGAYKLRQDSTKTTIIAFFSGILFLGFVSGMGMLLSSFGPKPVILPNEPLDDSIIVVKYEEPLIEKPKSAEPVTNNTAPVEEIPNNQNYVVATREEAKEPVPINADLSKNNTPIGTPGTGTPGTPGVIDGGGTEPKPEVIAPKGPVPPAELDKQPFFPGGIKKFYEYVGTNFEKQNIEEEEEGQAIKVLVTFVIEKNGSMTDIEVTRKTTPEIDKEAIRVLKSLKTKWAPGIKNGEPVRTQFTLPITVML